MNTITDIRKPILEEFEDYLSLFNSTLSHSEELQNTIFEQIKKRGGKRLRPTLTLLMAKAVGDVSCKTLHSAVALELLHTASLVHDDVVDNSDERRGQASVNSTNGNKLAVLLGDYILSTALLSVASGGDAELVSILARVGQTLADGEILQLKKDTNLDISYATYFRIIEQKTASLFQACCETGVKSAVLADNSTEVSHETVEKAVLFGNIIGSIFQIRDDIFDYLPTKELGKPAAKDMREGKITLPALYILNNFSCEKIEKLALKVKSGSITDDEIAYFIDYVLTHGGIEYAEKVMLELAEKAHIVADEITEKAEIREALHTLIDFFSKRNN
ncbi:MAG: polyprenyl synthetase family protein [Bacteroidaceae bacterium]|nr:polyprenyl synthetase family protein [Bacteroidaceae bacterium]